MFKSKYGIESKSLVAEKCFNWNVGAKQLKLILTKCVDTRWGGENEQKHSNALTNVSLNWILVFVIADLVAKCIWPV